MSFSKLRPENFRKVIEQSVALLQAGRSTGGPAVEFLLGDGVRDAEIRDIEASIGFSLDPRFVAFFRSANGFRVECGKRRAHVRPLRELFSPVPEPFFSGVGDNPILGGTSESDLKARLQPIGTLTDLDSSGYNVLALFANSANPDPVVLMVDDHGAAVGDHRPVRARDFLWLLALQLDVTEIVSDEWFEARGSAGAHPIVEPDLSSWELPSALDPKVRGDYYIDALCHLKGVVELKGWSKTEPPVRWYEEKHPLEGPAASIAAAVQGAVPGRAWDIDDSRGVLETSDGQLFVVIRFKRTPVALKDPHAPPPPERTAFANEVATSIEVVWSDKAATDDVERVRERTAALMRTGP